MAAALRAAVSAWPAAVLLDRAGSTMLAILATALVGLLETRRPSGTTTVCGWCQHMAAAHYSSRACLRQAPRRRSCGAGRPLL